MKRFPSGITFKYPWRAYQQRVLNELDDHLQDNHLHIIAPPGSGKTVLGLEVALRLNKPTLILAPTLAIRNQWSQRFCELFLQTQQTPAWISRNIKDPKFLTVATYHALHAVCAGVREEEESEEKDNDVEAENEEVDQRTKIDRTDRIVELLRAQNVGVIIVDEAHHLKNEWWKSLIRVKNALEPTIVGLTATPPYDVSHAEWQRYIDLNGPVDAEISVPELVAESDLCPHQDFIYFSRPTPDENRKIDDYRERIKTLFHEVKTDVTLMKALENHPIFTDPAGNTDWIYANFETYAAILIFLNSANKEITSDHKEIVGDRKARIPELDYEWLEILLSFYLYSDSDYFHTYQDHRESLIGKLRRSGALEKRAINLQHNRKINTSLASSISKLKSIENIVDFERVNLEGNLRLVILTDYIRKEFLPNEPENKLELLKIGVAPIFEQLRRSSQSQRVKLGVLTGSLIIIPAESVSAFNAVAAHYGADNVPMTPLPFDQRYYVVHAPEKIKHDIVYVMTQIFQDGHIEVLIGTKSLLGEGWDAPAINALVLASFVGSYVLSNQMRGRAIRTERQNLDKTANIWHLVCIDPTSIEGGDDLETLKRRFKAFVGISLTEKASIENGIGRLQLSERISDEREIEHVNSMMLSHAGRRSRLKECWRKALTDGTLLVEEIKAPFPRGKDYQGLKSLYYNRTIAHALAVLGSGLLAFGEFVFHEMVELIGTIRNPEEFFKWLAIFGVGAVVIFGGQFFKVARMYVKFRDITKDIENIGHALLETLIHIGTIQTDRAKLYVAASVDDYGAIYCHLKGATTYEKSTFIAALHEIIGAVENPRYIIIRKSFFLDILAQKDYHSVPEIIGRKKEYAQYFEREWARQVGVCELVYTRRIEGRKLLLQSRMHALAAEFEDRTERINTWR